MILKVNILKKEQSVLISLEFWKRPHELTQGIAPVPSKTELNGKV